MSNTTLRYSKTTETYFLCILTGTVQAKNLTRHLLYKLIKYTLPPVKNTTGFTNLTTSTAFTSDDVEILHQQHVITNLTFKEYETLYDSIFPVSGKIEC